MNKLLIFVLLLIILSFLLGVLISRIMSEPRTAERGGITDFSVETRAVCEELRQPNCYFKCHDEIFLKLSGREISLYKSSDYVCHEEGWVDPRVKK